ncbi:MAG: universal stress protein [Jatrophihabitantaceae bacterium]
MSVGPVVVGVDNTVDACSAVLWAAHEAALAQTSLLILHSPQAPSARSDVPRDCDDVGQSVLRNLETLAQAARPDVVVSTLLSHADPGQALINLSTQARLMVLGSRSAMTGEVSLLASERILVSGRAHCPVLLLGPVSTFGSPRGVSRVVVGVAATRAARAAVVFATTEAVRHNVALHLVRVEPEPVGQPTRRAAGPGEMHSTGLLPVDSLSAEAREIRRNYPNLTVLAHSATGDATESLLSYSDSSSILVVGCRRSNDRWSTRLGPVATSVLHRSRGPVVVVGIAHDAEGPRCDTALSGRGFLLVL